ncbi:hypothetical protein [Flavobacterium sp. CS20]|jgi:hypothetical protein|uniref:hypothetical protein n=1 Tax=Flavobacterium sp. CS20 TaxID=2775246 RepID=UPI001B3A5D88|nr:hypothetical protein [Flavobacterium sp. CS20]QTY27196.1 hypothetical protein IGB25_00925 [Flavobacterium sp. CS20]
MKTINLKTLKNQHKSILTGLCVATLLFTSCNNNDDNLSESSISEEEASEAIIMAVSPETGGLIEMTTETITIVEGSSSDYSKTSLSNSDFDYVCGETYGTSFARSHDSGNYSYNINYVWSWTVYCTDDNSPTNFSFDLNASSSYDSPKMSSDDTTNGTLVVSGLDDLETEYLVNQTYSRSGTQISSVRNQNTFTSSLNFNTTNLKVLKANHNITSGSISVAFNGQVSNGNVYDYSGTIVFNGNQTATLTMGSGNTYNFAW